MFLVVNGPLEAHQLSSLNIVCETANRHQSDILLNFHQENQRIFFCFCCSDYWLFIVSAFDILNSFWKSRLTYVSGGQAFDCFYFFHRKSFTKDKNKKLSSNLQPCQKNESHTWLWSDETRVKIQTNHTIDLSRTKQMFCVFNANEWNASLEIQQTATYSDWFKTTEFIFIQLFFQFNLIRKSMKNQAVFVPLLTVRLNTNIRTVNPII